MTTPDGAAADPPPAKPPVEHKPIDGIALFKEVALERLENLLEWLLMRLRRFRARRGNWWE